MLWKVQLPSQSKRKLLVCRSIYAVSGVYFITPLQYTVITLHINDLYFSSFETTCLRNQLDLMVLIMIRSQGRALLLSEKREYNTNRLCNETDVLGCWNKAKG